MTPTEQTRQRVLQAISEEADDFGAEHLTPATELRADLYMSSSSRIALACALEKEFGPLDDAAWAAITHLYATCATVCDAVIRNTSKETA